MRLLSPCVLHSPGLRSGSCYWEYGSRSRPWGYLVYGESDSTKSALVASTLVLPVGIAGLVARAERRRGHTVWRAGSIGFILGALVGAVTPLLQLYLICAVTRDCL